jgi:hypothetical protein
MSMRLRFGAYALGAYLLIVGFLGGMIASAVRYDAKRQVVLSQLEDASTRVRAHLMRFEGDAARTGHVSR